MEGCPEAVLVVTAGDLPAVASGDGKRLEQLWVFMAGVQRVCVIP